MDDGGTHEHGPAMSPLKKFPTSDDEYSETKDDPAEESNSKPLKKARYVWQIKGNYHLKNSNCDSESKGSSVCPQSEASSSEAKEIMNHNSHTSACEPTAEGVQSAPLCDHHPSASQSVVDSTSNSEDQYPPLPPLRIGATTVNCVVCDTFNENIRRASCGLPFDGERSSTPPLPTSHPDWNVRKWQTRQIAKAFMDNTINSVLEEMGFTPVPESAPDSDPEDILSSINYPRAHLSSSGEESEEDESVENEGILSAIQRHGLQRHALQSLPEVSNRFIYSSSSPTRCSPSPPKIWGPNQGLHRHMYDIEESPSSPESLSVGSTFGAGTKDKTRSPFDMEVDGTYPTSDSNSDDDDDASCPQGSCAPTSCCKCKHLASRLATDILQPSQNAILYSNGLLSSSHSGESNGSTEFDNSNKCASPNPQHELSRLSEQDDEIVKKRQGNGMLSSGVSKRRCVDPTDDYLKGSFTSSKSATLSVLDSGAMSTSDGNDRNSPTFGHFEFMDAAVAAAIQKKGLSALACQDL